MKPYIPYVPKGNYVPGEGPVPSELMFIGERPGRDEDRLKRPFVGKTGQLLEMFLKYELSTERSKVYLTNLVKRGAINDAAPTPEDVAAYEGVLKSEIEAVNPWVVASLGRSSTRWLLGDVDMEVVHGIPHMANDGRRVVLPIFHPAAGLHNTEIQAKVAYGFQQLRLLMDGKIEVGAAEDEHPKPNYQRYESMHILNSAWGPWAIDTEGHRGNPWGGSATNRPGCASVFPRLSIEPGIRTILHNSMHDLGVLKEMGVELADGSFDDTMVMAYLLCVEPQGLKALALRHCGMAMDSYDDVTSAASYRKALDFLFEVYECLNARVETRREAISGAEIEKSSTATGARIRKSGTRTSKKLAKRGAKKR